MKTEVWETFDGFLWRIRGSLWYAEAEHSYTRRSDAKRGLHRFLARVRSK